MNIFVLDKSPRLAAQYHCDKHVVKMVLESAQILSSVHHKMTLEVRFLSQLYKPTHSNHPCVIWATKSYKNYSWLYRLFVCLCEEYTHRYGKVHLSQRKLEFLLRMYPVQLLSCEEQLNSPLYVDLFVDHQPDNFALAMPDEYKRDDPVQSYRDYYAGEKKDFLKYTNREHPEWLGELV